MLLYNWTFYISLHYINWIYHILIFHQHQKQTINDIVWKTCVEWVANTNDIEVVASIAWTKLRVGLGSLTQNIWNESSWSLILGQPCQWSFSLYVWICPSWPFFVSPPIYRQPAMVSGVRRTICHIHYFVGASDMWSITKWGEEFLEILKSSTKVKLECSGKGRALLTRA